MDYKSELAIRLEQIPELTLTTTHVGLETEKFKVNDKEEIFYQDRWIIVLDYKELVYDTTYRSGYGNRKLLPGVVADGRSYYNKFYRLKKNVKEACE